VEQKVSKNSLDQTKDKLFKMAEGNRYNFSPYSVDLKTTDDGKLERVGGSAQLGDFTFSGSYNPGFTQTQSPPPGAPPFVQEREIKIPSNYNVGVTYQKGPFRFNYQHGSRGSQGGANFNYQF